MTGPVCSGTGGPLCSGIGGPVWCGIRTLIDGPSILTCEFNKKEPVKSEKPTIECGYSLEIIADTETKNVKISIIATSNSDSVPFMFNVKSEGIFLINNCPIEIIDKVAFEKNVLTKTWPYMFTFLKEVIADLTRKADLPTFNLPPIDLELERVDK